MYYEIDEDDQSIYESTLEQVVAFDKRGKSIYSESSLYQSAFDFKPNRHYSVCDESSYIGNNKENFNGDFHSIDIDDHILKYSRRARGGKTNRHILDSIIEDDKDSQDEDGIQASPENNKADYKRSKTFTHKDQNASPKEDIFTPVKRKVEKDDIHQAIAINNSKSKAKPKRKIYMFDFSSDVEEEEKDHFSNENLRLKANDTSVCEVNFNDDFDTPEDDTNNTEDLEFNLNRLIFQGDLNRIEYLYDKRLLTTEILEKPDHRGNRPIHLAAKLSKRDEKYLYIVQFLLNIGVNFKSKDKEGWNIIDESVTHINIRLMGIIFDYC